jgi:hypothetical protein
MSTLRRLAPSKAPTWARAAWPVVALAVAGILDQSTRRPSIAHLIYNLCC